MRGLALAALLAGSLLLTACGRDDAPAPTSGSAGAPASAVTAPPASAPPAAPAPAVSAPVAAGPGDAAKGRQVWLAQCVACHNADPAKDGTVGPAVKGASAALLEARVLHAEYPPGYQPKRPTRVMPARPDLGPALPDLIAYLR